MQTILLIFLIAAIGYLVGSIKIAAYASGLRPFCW